MKNNVFECFETGIISKKPYDFPAQFSTEMKYSVLYRNELERFLRNPLKIYALPFSDKPEKIYNGLGRMGVDDTNLSDKSSFASCSSYSDFEELMLNEHSARDFLNACKNSQDYELIWTRIYGSEEHAPDGYRFIGFDVSYPPNCDGAFSIICDCMFICRWHGCDEQGLLFYDDFSKLNTNGLFDNPKDAYSYMEKYLNQDWTERGEYGIFEIYMKI